MLDGRHRCGILVKRDGVWGLIYEDKFYPIDEALDGFEGKYIHINIDVHKD